MRPINKTLLFLATTLLFSGGGCTTAPSEKKKEQEAEDRSASIPQEPREGGVVETVSPEPFKNLKKRREKALLLDVRTPEEVARGAIPGACNLNFHAKDFKKELMEKVGNKDTVMVYCASGGRSGKTARILKENGVTYVCDLKGGIRAWKEAGFKVVQE